MHRLDRQLLRQPCFPLQLGTSTGRCIDASTTMPLRRQAPTVLLQPHAPGRPLPALIRLPGTSTPGPCRASNSNSSQWFPQAGGDEPSTRPANSSADEQPSSSTSSNSNGSESSSSAGSPSSSGSSEGNGKPAEQSEVRHAHHAMDNHYLVLTSAPSLTPIRAGLPSTHIQPFQAVGYVHIYIQGHRYSRSGSCTS